MGGSAWVRALNTKMAESQKQSHLLSTQSERGRWIWPILIITAGVATHLPALGWGFFSDDYGHQVILRGLTDHDTMRPWSLYDFGDFPKPDESMWKVGTFPWWTSANWKIRFYRPVTSISLWLDHAVWGNWAVGYHITGLLLFSLDLLMAYFLFRKLSERRGVALLGLAIMAASFSALLPVGWPANRNSLLAQLFMIGALLVLIPPRGRPFLWGRWVVACLLGVLATMSKESGIVTFPLLGLATLPWKRLHGDAADGGKQRPALVLQKGSWPASLCSLAVGILYLLGLAAAGFGARGLFYTTPWLEPGLYIERVLVLLATAPLTLIGFFSTDLFLERFRLLLLLAPICLLFSMILVAVFWRVLRRHRYASFLLAWFVLAILPQGGAPTSDRLLFEASPPASLLLGIFLCGVLSASGRSRHGRAMRIAALMIVVFTIPSQALAKLAVGAWLGKATEATREAVITAEVGPEKLGQREVFVLQAPNSVVLLNAISTWVVETGDRDVRFWPMQYGGRGLVWRRIDDRTFELESLDRPFLTHLLESVFLTSGDPPSSGTHWETALFRVDAIDGGTAGLRSIRVSCPESLDTPRYRFLICEKGKLRSVEPPPVGASRVIDAVPARAAQLP